MADLSAFIDAHPWVTFGVFAVAMQLAGGIGKWFRIRVGAKFTPNDEALRRGEDDGA